MISLLAYQALKADWGETRPLIHSELRLPIHVKQLIQIFIIIFLLKNCSNQKIRHPLTNWLGQEGYVQIFRRSFLTLYKGYVPSLFNFFSFPSVNTHPSRFNQLVRARPSGSPAIKHAVNDLLSFVLLVSQTRISLTHAFIPLSIQAVQYFIRDYQQQQINAFATCVSYFKPQTRVLAAQRSLSSLSSLSFPVLATRLVI